MSKHLWGLHWMESHKANWDMGHIQRMNYKSIKLFEWMWSNLDLCNELLVNVSQECLFVLRDQPMSEQKSDMWADPAGTGRRHALDWVDKFNGGKIHLPSDRCAVLGINEADAVNGDRDAIDIYNSTFLHNLWQHQLRGGGLSFGEGNPRTIDGTEHTKRDWSPFERTHQAIVRGNHFLVMNEYGSAENPGWGYWLCGYESCPWQDVRIIIGECGIDEMVKGGENHIGWQISLPDFHAYTTWLDAYHAHLTADFRIHSAMVFTFDFNHPWASFDVHREDITTLWENYQWAYAQEPTIDTAPQKPTPKQDANWERCIEFVLGQEGGYTPGIPGDPGGETNWGISKAANPDLDIKNLTREQAKDVYLSRYWFPSGAYAYPFPMSLMIFDAAVQHGVGRARSLLELSGGNPYRFMGERLKFYGQIKTFNLFGEAWINRMGDLMVEAA